MKDNDTGNLLYFFVGILFIIAIIIIFFPTVDNTSKVSANIVLTDKEITLKIGDTYSLQYNVTPADSKLIFISSDEKIVTVDNSGNIKGLKSGTATITAKTDDKHQSVCLVKVQSNAIPVTGITLNKTEVEMDVGKTLQLSVDIKPINATDRKISWTTSDQSIATVSSKGLVTAKKAGTVTIIAQVGNKKAVCLIDIEDAGIQATSITLNKTSASIVEGNTLDLVATIKPDNTTNKKVTWTTSDQNIATVSNGKVTAKKAGTAIITAKTSNGKTATATITVTNVTLFEAYFLNSINSPGFSKKLTTNNAFIFKTNDGKYVLSDTGISSDDIKNLIYKKLKELQGKTKVVVDYLIISHLDSDHYGNATKILSDKNFNIKNLIIKKEGSKTSYYNKIAKAATDNKVTKVIESSTLKDGASYTLNSNVKIYLFNTKDVFKGKTGCTEYSKTDHAVGFVVSVSDLSTLAKDTNNKYIYFEGEDYLKNGGNTKIYTSDKVEFKIDGMKSRFYATSALVNNCRSNSNSIATLFQIKTASGNKYVYVPGDLENNGYYPLGEFDTAYNQTIHGVAKTYYYEYKLVNNVPKFIVKNNKFTKSTKTPIVKAPSEYLTALNIKNKFKDILGNIVIYQAAHHNLNNSEEAINTLNINRSDVYVVSPSGNSSKSKNFRHIFSTYSLRNTQMLFTGIEKQNGIKCTITSSSKTKCAGY